jgi:hypothetical protein
LLVSIKGPLLLVATEARSRVALTQSWPTVLGRHESTRLAYAAYAGSAGLVWPTCVMPRMFDKIRPRRQELDGKTAPNAKIGGSPTEKGASSSDADDQRR